MNQKLKIVIADDKEESRKMLVESLTGNLADFEIEAAGDGAECMSLLRNGCEPDLLFLNLNMPVKNGLECLRDIRKYELIPGIPVILYSSSQRLKAIKEAAGFGASFYMVRPASTNILKELVQRIFSLLYLPMQEQQKKENFVVAEQKLSRVLNYHFAI